MNPDPIFIAFFQEDLIEAGLIGKLLQLIKDHNSDTQYWIIQVIHEFLHMRKYKPFHTFNTLQLILHVSW